MPTPLLILSLLLSTGANAQPTVAPDNIQTAILAAAHAGLASFTIPPGQYRLASTLKFSDLSNFEIVAANVTFIRADPAMGAIQFINCRNVSLRGLTLLNPAPPFTQGTVQSIDPAGKTIDLLVDAGYSTAYLTARKTTGYAFNPQTRQWKNDAYDYGIASGQILDGQLLRITFDQPLPKTHNLAAGDLLAFRGPGAQDIYLARCSRMNITGLTILSGSGFCIHEDGGDGDNHYNYKLTYGPKPPGATAAPLIASNADAFHSGGVRHGPTLEDCSFEGMCDDGIPIHGYYAMVFDAHDNQLIVAKGHFLREAVPVRLFDNQGALVGEAAVTAATPAKDYQPATRPTDKSFEDAREFQRITLDKPLPAKPGYRVSSPAANGSNFVIRNCTIKNHRARGLLIKADNGLIENNTIDGSTIAALVIAPEFWWSEACYSRNLIIRNNTFRHCGYATAGPWTNQAATVSILGEGNDKGIAQGHQHITIENNTFEDNDGANLLINGAQDVQVLRNHFLRPQQHPSLRGIDHKVDPAVLISLSNCDNVTVKDNTVSTPGRAHKSLIQTVPSAINVTGLDNGVKCIDTPMP